MRVLSKKVHGDRKKLLRGLRDALISPFTDAALATGRKKLLTDGGVLEID
jgi:hypothetical protein